MNEIERKKIFAFKLEGKTLGCHKDRILGVIYGTFLTKIAKSLSMSKGLKKQTVRHVIC